METRPLFAPKGQLKLAGGGANWTTPLAAPPGDYVLIFPSQIKSVMDGGFDLAQNFVGRTPACSPCQGCKKNVGKTQLSQGGKSPWQGWSEVFDWREIGSIRTTPASTSSRPPLLLRGGGF